jgi:hypothetical protein
MSRWVRVLGLLAAGGIVGLGAEVAHPGTRWTALALLGGAVAAGELVELRPSSRAALPMSFAFVVVLAYRSTITEALLVMTPALIGAALLRRDADRLIPRLSILAERSVELAASILCYHSVYESFHDQRTRASVLIALSAAAVAPIVVSDLIGLALRRKATWGVAGRAADLAIVTSAVLMAVADRGVTGNGMGLWGPAVFTIPVLGAWYSYDRLAETRRTYDQTLRALAAAPELGGMVRDGHAERVADLSVAIGAALGMTAEELAHLEAAALLHHLGEVCLDEPEDGGALDAAAVAEAGAAILRSTTLLAPAGDVVSSEAALSLRPASAGDAAARSGQILKVANVFDELCEGILERAGLALEALNSAPGYLYNREVLVALESVLDGRALLGSMM